MVDRIFLDDLFHVDPIFYLIIFFFIVCVYFTMPSSTRIYIGILQIKNKSAMGSAQA